MHPLSFRCWKELGSVEGIWTYPPTAVGGILRRSVG